MSIKVKIWGQDVGYMTWSDEKQTAAFTYDKDFTQSGPNISPLIMNKIYKKTYEYEENRNTKCFKGLPSVFADSLPDNYGNELIKNYWEKIGRTDANPLDYLAYIGERGMGALEYEPSIKFEDSNSLININDLTEIVNNILDDRKKFINKLKEGDKTYLDILKIGTSAGGAKPKAIIAYNKKTKEVRSGQITAPEGFGYYLLKFDSYLKDGELAGDGLDTKNKIIHGATNLEYAYHLAAKDCGINMTECFLLKEKNNSHFVTKRFDRKENGEKIHMLTLSGIANLNRDEPHSYDDLFLICRKLNLDSNTTTEVFRRMVFNVIFRNHDDHAKNHSFLMDKDSKWKLAPAYDLSYSYNPTGQFTNKHQMSINGKKDNIDYTDLMKVAERNDVKNPKEIMQKVIESAKKWKKFSEQAEVNNAIGIFVESNLVNIKIPIKNEQKPLNNKPTIKFKRKPKL